MVRSQIRDRFELSQAPKDLKDRSLPPEVVVSMPSVSDLKPTSFSARSSIRAIRCLRSNLETVQPPHHDGVARPELIEEPIELGTAVQ